MTRTERAAFPRAVVKDRSESKSGLDKSIRKGGAGQHNWGSFSDERELEFAAMADEEMDFAMDKMDNMDNMAPAEMKKPGMSNSLNSPNEEELKRAKDFRKNVFKGEVDLAAIARTSAGVSMSPLTPGSASSMSRMEDVMGRESV